MAEVMLPDCTDFEFRFTLTPEEEEQLLQEIAEKGREGLEEFARRYSSVVASGKLGEQLRRYRKRLEEQASRILNKRRRQLEEEERALHQLMRIQVPDGVHIEIMLRS